VYTVKYFDEAGNLVKIWHGSKAEADKIKQQEQGTRKKLLLASKLSNINRVNSCALPNDFFTTVFSHTVVLLHSLSSWLDVT